MIDQELRTVLGEATRIVFVCSGNMVRSAFADLYAKHIGIEREVASVATTYRNNALYPETAAALRQRGIDAGTIRSFRPTHVEDAPELFREGTLLFAMTHSHLHALATSPASHCPVFLFPRILGQELEIADPVLEGADFEVTFRTLGRCVEALRDELQART